MRILSLKIKRYKNLKDFEIGFEEKEPINVLLGRNGSAKSNLIEALVEIFGQLESKSHPTFHYQLCYICRRKKVEIDAGFTNEETISVSTSDGALSYAQLVDGKMGNFLPSHVFVYYSGTSDRLGKLFNSSVESYRRDLHQKQDRQLRRMFFTRGNHSGLILFCFLADEDPWSMRFLKRRFSIEKLQSARIHLRQSAHSKSLRPEAKTGDSRFWFTGGQVEQAIKAIYTAGIPLRNFVRTKRGEEIEDLFVFFPDEASLIKLRDMYQRKKDLFQALDDLYVDDFLKGIRFRLFLRGEEKPIEFTELSEGEQQLISVIGLLRFTKDQESLFLLDEPDTHLNPLWGMEYQDMLSDAMTGEKTSQIIMATHDPMVVSGLTQKSVRVMGRTTENGKKKIVALPPEEDPRGMGIGRILTSDMFGLRSILDNKTQTVLDHKRELLSKPRLSKKDLAKLDEYNEKLKGIDATLLATDPLYPLFVEAMVKHPDYDKVRRMVDDIKRKQGERRIASIVTNEIIASFKRTQ
jgi:predicted ATPase